MRYLFNTRGKYVGFVSGRNIFLPDSRFVGFIPRANEVYAADG